MIAAGARAASMNVSVAPLTVHPGVAYTVTITGRYDKWAHPRPPYLLAFIQYSANLCKRTATAEYALPSKEWSWDFYPERAEAASPFKSVSHWTAGPRLGTRRVCAYLYAKQISPTSADKPLASASASFVNTRPPPKRRRT
jgi:hypothetical protein